MLSFLLQRSLSGVLVLIGVIAIVFLLLNIIPVNAELMSLGQNADEATILATQKKLRLNYSPAQRFWYYLSDLSPISVQGHEDESKALYLLSGDYKYLGLMSFGSKTLILKYPYLGRSFQSDEQVSTILSKKIVPTLILALSAMSFAIVLGIGFGIISALNYGKFWDKFLVSISVLGISIPSYFSALLLAIFFGYYLSDYTHLNITGALIDVSDLGEYYFNWKNLILPSIALGIRPVAIILQLTRNSMLEVLGSDYVRTAKAKGLSSRVVLFKHALRNALNPVITSITGWFAALLAGAFFVEYIFDFKGLGHETVRALSMFDFPLVMGAVLLIACSFIFVNILVDILYSALDPRIRIDG